MRSVPLCSSIRRRVGGRGFWGNHDPHELQPGLQLLVICHTDFQQCWHHTTLQRGTLGFGEVKQPAEITQPVLGILASAQGPPRLEASLSHHFHSS